MLIRCERCSTTYELDEALLSPEGSEVQCARCQHVFTVRPPRAPGQTLHGVPAPEPEPAPPASLPRAATPSHGTAASSTPPHGTAAGPTPPHGAAAGAGAQAGAAATHRPTVYRPPVSNPTISRPPVIRRDTVGTFESRLRWSHRWKWLAPALVVALAAIVVAGYALRQVVVDQGARRDHERALKLALADDVQSLEQARAALDQAVLASPKLHAARADRALVDLLLAGTLAEAPGDRAEQKARRERSKALVDAAGKELAELQQAGLARPEVARARAVAAAFGASRAELRRLATVAQGELPGDPWVTAVEASVDVRSTERAARERALSDLSVLVSRRPDVLRARYVLARGQALTGRRNEALATLDALLKTNARHDAALALREAITHPPSGTTVAPAVTAAAVEAPPEAPARAEKTAALPRKPDSTSGEAGAAPRTPKPVTPKPPPPAEDVAPPPVEEPSAAGEEAAPAPEPPPAPRLRPAAVPEPEPVRGGG